MISTTLLRQAALKYLGLTDLGQPTNALVLQAANQYLTTDRIALNDAVMDAMNQYLTVDKRSFADAIDAVARQYLAGDPTLGGPANAALSKYLTVPPAPVNTVAPVISGTATGGQVLTSTTGTWSGSPTYTYQWKRGVTNVGTNANTYTLVAGDVGANMTCVVTATNAGGSASATSNSLGPVAAAFSAWNPSDLSGVTLSNNNRTATAPAALGGVRSTTSHTTGQRYFEVTIVLRNGEYPGFGVGNAAAPLGAYMGSTAQSIGYFPGNVTGEVYQNNAVVASLGQFTTGSWGVLVDATARTIQFQRIGGSLSAALAITATGPLFAMMSAQSNASLTINTGQEAFLGTLPGGYSAWG